MASAGDSSGQMSAKNPVFCIKQLYSEAEGWTVAVVAKILNYREKKVVEIMKRIPPNLDTIHTKAVERHLFEFEGYDYTGSTYTTEELKLALYNVICIGAAINASAESIGMKRAQFNVHINTVKVLLNDAYLGYGEIMKEGPGRNHTCLEGLQFIYSNCVNFWS